MSVLSPILHLRGTARKAFLSIVEVLVVLTLLFVMAIAYTSFCKIAPPIKLHEPAIISAAEIHNHGEVIIGHEVHISRDVTFFEPVTVNLSTTLTNKENGYSIDLTDTKISSSILGKITSQKIYYVSHLATGEWCMASTAAWRPALSFNTRYINSNESCFKVE